MPKPWRTAILAAVFWTAGSAWAEPLTYVPVALGWTAEEVERAAEPNATAIIERARREGALGCTHDCDRLERIFNELVARARLQGEAARAKRWTLTVVQLPEVEAMALPGGQVLIGQPFIEQRAAGDDTLAFVLAHEIAHSVLEHERQALTYARQLLPRQVPRSVQDMYVELAYNFSLLKALEPVMRQGEFEADELGLLLAASAGFDPQKQLAFIEREAAEDSGDVPLVRTHPSAPERVEALRARLPLAQRLYEMAR